jgi:hypothetical protein
MIEIRDDGDRFRQKSGSRLTGFFPVITPFVMG